MDELDEKQIPNRLAIIVAFYLSKFDKVAKNRLGYKTDAEAFQEISQILGVKSNYIKFRRDEFDPIHPWRIGWTRRPMAFRIVQTIEALQDLSEHEIGGIVESILFDTEFQKSGDLKKITALVDDQVTTKKPSSTAYILRGPTGKKAEEYFISYHTNFELPVKGTLIDTREMGCGYDFKIEVQGYEYYIEVKGLSQEYGGIIFTNKEWETAQNYGERYIVAIISNIDSSPVIKFIKNPASKLNPKRNIVRPIQVQWSVSNSDLNHV